jgi:hypothetical protein
VNRVVYSSAAIAIYGWDDVHAWRLITRTRLFFENSSPKSRPEFNSGNGNGRHLTIVEIVEFVELGRLNPDELVTPGIYVDRVVAVAEFQAPVERRPIKEHAQS